MQLALRGVLELFEIVYVNDDSSIGVKVALSLIEDSVGSNSPGAQDYREGSVPSISGPTS